MKGIIAEGIHLVGWSLALHKIYVRLSLYGHIQKNNRRVFLINYFLSNALLLSGELQGHYAHKLCLYAAEVYLSCFLLCIIISRYNN